MTRAYFTLKVEHGDTLHSHGTVVTSVDRDLLIGQTAACQLSLPKDGKHVEVEYALIQKVDYGTRVSSPADKNEAWKLIVLSPYKQHEVRVNGMAVNYVCFLNDGDIISFAGQEIELRFNIHTRDSSIPQGVMEVRQSNRPIYIISSIFFIVLLVTAYLLLMGRGMTNRMVDLAKESVVTMHVDSVRLLSVAGSDTTVLETVTTNIRNVGFVTTEGLLVTARHCIEPWLNIPDTLNIDTTTVQPEYVRMAAIATTLNVSAVDTHYIIQSCLTLNPSGKEGGETRIYSTDFSVNRTRDNLIEYGDYDHQYFWYSISARPNYTDMMLGDIAWMRLDGVKGTIRLASPSEVRHYCGHAGEKLTILGCPEKDINRNAIEKSEDDIRTAVTFDDDGYAEIPIGHNGQITRGFSGGPLIVRCGLNGWCAIGVVSVTDNENRNRCYSVPISEIDRFENNRQ